MKFKLLMTVGLVGVLGACSTAAATPKAAPKDTNAPATVPVTQERVEYQTPQACKDALEEAEQVFEVARDLATTTSKIFFTIKDAMAAVAASDVSGMEQATSDIENGTAGINALTVRVKTIMPLYNANAAACRAS